MNGDTAHRSLFLEHTTDTGYSSSGSPVIDLNSFTLIGIHTFGVTERLVNNATAIMGHQKLQDLIKVCVKVE